MDASKVQFGDAQKDIVKAFVNNEWVEVNGIVDSGCTTTTGSIQQHAKYCKTVFPYLGPKCRVRIADNSTLEVTKEGIMHVKVNGVEIEDMLVKLVDAPEWPKLLIGRNSMIHYKIPYAK